MNIKNLVILTSKFGDYTGATVSTQELLKFWINHFDNIYILTETTSSFIESYKNVYIIKSKRKFFRNKLEEIKKENKNLIGYSDDHLGNILYEANIKFIHTYHGNWPDARYVSIEYFFKSFYFLKKYKTIFRHASKIVNVSIYMDNFNRKYTNKTTVIRNGVKNFSDYNKQNYSKKFKFLMVGGVDKRKYSKMIKVCKEIDHLICEKDSLEIDIYGEIYDQKIYKSLKKYKFINFKGRVEKVDYSDYCVFLSCSSSENLSIAIVEALKSGLQVFSYNIGGLNEVIKSGFNGYFMNKKNNLESAQIIIDYISHKKNQNLKYNEPDYYEYSWNISSRKYIHLFEELFFEEN